MKRMHSMSRIAAVVAVACAAPFALAQTMPAQQHPQSGSMTHTPPYQTTPTQSNEQMPQRIPQASQSMGVMGQHDMTGTVRSVSSNGIVVVHTDDGNLRVHFPDASQHLKKGDRITLHLSYSMAPPASM